jgi:hypothetical protein
MQPNELQRPTISDTAVVRLPIWLYGLTAGRVLEKLGKNKSGADEDADDVAEAGAEGVVDDDDSEPAQPTPSSDSAADDFEFLDKSVESVAKAKSTGAQGGGGGKANKRKGKKR